MGMFRVEMGIQGWKRVGLGVENGIQEVETG